MRIHTVNVEATSGDLAMEDQLAWKIAELSDHVAIAAPNAQGTGYVVGDVVTVVGGTFFVACTCEVTQVGGSGEVDDGHYIRDL